MICFSSDECRHQARPTTCLFHSGLWKTRVKPFRSSAFTGVTILLLCCCSGRQHPDVDVVYSDSMHYLDGLSNEAVRVLRTVLAASQLDEIREALVNAQHGEDAKYSTFINAHSTPAVPEPVRHIVESANDAHRSFQNAISEFLRYWEDTDPSHIVKGRIMLERSMNQANDTANDIRAQRR